VKGFSDFGEHNDGGKAMTHAKGEQNDTWPEIVKVLDKYSMEAWRSGVSAEQERIIKLLEENLDKISLYQTNNDEEIGVQVGLDIALRLIRENNND
jgi:hypothetical protein